jgi:hypothetical protein
MRFDGDADYIEIDGSDLVLNDAFSLCIDFVPDEAWEPDMPIDFGLFRDD